MKGDHLGMYRHILWIGLASACLGGALVAQRPRGGGGVEQGRAGQGRKKQFFLRELSPRSLHGDKTGTGGGLGTGERNTAAPQPPHGDGTRDVT